MNIFVLENVVSALSGYFFLIGIAEIKPGTSFGKRGGGGWRGGSEIKLNF